MKTTKECQNRILDLIQDFNKILETRTIHTDTKFSYFLLNDENKRIIIIVYLLTVYGDNTNYEGLLKCLFNKICDITTQSDSIISLEDNCIRIEIEIEKNRR